MLALQAPKGSQPKTRSPPTAKPLPDATKGLAAVEGEIPIMMPAKLATNKARFHPKRDLRPSTLPLCMLHSCCCQLSYCKYRCSDSSRD